MEGIRLSFGSPPQLFAYFLRAKKLPHPGLCHFPLVPGNRNPDDEHSSNTAIVLITPYALYRQQCCTDSAAHRIRYQVRPSRLPAGEIHLMPLIKHANQQRAEKCEDQPLPIRQSARHANCPRQQGENNAMNQLVPRGRYQIYSNRLRSSDKQADHDPECEQHGHEADGAR